MAPNAPEMPENAFQTDAVRVVGRARDAISRMIESKCPADPAVTAICEAFGVHRKLAWQMTKVAYATDPFLAARHMPTPKALRTWLDAASGAGVPSEMIAKVREAGEAFEAMAGAHATNRSELELLFESCQSEKDEQVDIRWRQQCFQGNSYVWGAQCRVLLGMTVLLPSRDTARFFHAAQVRGILGFKQVRPGVRWVVNQSVIADDEARPRATLTRVPLDSAGALAHGGVPVLPEYCSSPVPETTRRPTPDGMVHDEFVAGPVGPAGERSIVTGELIRNIGADHATETDRVAHFGMGVRTPAEQLHYDLFVHKGLFGDVEREALLFSDLASNFAFDEGSELPIPEKLIHLGRGLNMAHAPDVPRCVELVSRIFDLLGEDAGDYDAYRVRMPYPPMPTSVMVRHELLPKEQREQ